MVMEEVSPDAKTWFAHYPVLGSEILVVESVLVMMAIEKPHQGLLEVFVA